MSGTLAQIGAANLGKILIVAGGGGGGAYHANNTECYGGPGGGASGSIGFDENGGWATNSQPGTQTSGYAFGQGGPATDWGSAGGGGLYGGTGVYSGCGPGGSGYIGGVPSFTYNGVTYSPSTSNGSSAVPANENSHNSDGVAKITLVESIN